MGAERLACVTEHHVPNAVQAPRFLLRQQPFEDVPVPDLVLLDLLMPIFDGTTVLESMREHLHLTSTPVVIFTSSTLRSDRLRCQELGATDYIKTADWVAWQEKIYHIMAERLSGFRH